ncbi:ApeA N-terminal domain 1-containing protein [Streptomyces erythrochromogenes]|uniref:ApeA N-terminal domain 1-containing protein n=1 Tax=Streptomyces erythrochromogenes TaxID=285574 RepID=UPI00368782FD
MEIGDISGGSVGFFWATYGKRITFHRRPESGHLKLNPDGQIEIQTLEESPEDSFISETSPGLPTAIFASTAAGGVLIPQISRRSSKVRWGGIHASTHSFFGPAAVLGVSEAIKDPRLSYASLFMPGIQDWAGVRTIEAERKSSTSGRMQAMSITVKNSPPQEVRLSGSMSFELAWHWQVSGSADNKSVYAPVSLAVRSTRPRAYQELMAPLHRIQDLASLSFGGFVRADGGRAHFAGEPDPTTSPTIWDGRFMSVPAGARSPKSMTELPLFSLADIGGLDGLRRWLAIYESHPRAVRPFVARYRLGVASPEVRLMEVAAGMEYWVASHRRTTKWAKEKFIPLVVAKRVGPSFGEWVQDPEKWANAFWGTYNSIKHEAKYVPDRHQVSVMAESGSLLLAAAIANRVSGGRSVARKIFQSYRIKSLGEEAANYSLMFSSRGSRKGRK